MGIQQGTRIPGSLYAGSPGFVNGEYRIENGPRNVASLNNWSDGGNTPVKLISNLPNYPYWQDELKKTEKNKLRMMQDE
jgi:hypothetical protein